MDAILLLIVLVFIVSLRPNLRGPSPDYLNRTTTASINGLFLMLVLFSHLVTYMPPMQHWSTLTNLWMAH
ncbi:hypothetical protein AYR62_03265 [Secundilactobacillus paracollinoides]|uniref:Uncharacterized protein n=1 Tax=Secundilactobacillus paracollinoides TaxID=240427 RepID=A0A1B2IZL4_9LACO|nr:hypothetical protein AYR61_09535 [Secundilactobacillus paracollinoides]ANZ63215.1 hypothetical protein AYR62_03265 [Secundilactobacillus paracollinoides]ANZ67493.1 hypothetical protein AYR63_10285 [Secundilactobacillus paracollinoides]